jgi:hypothetical protein
MDTGVPDRGWTSDISYLRTGQGSTPAPCRRGSPPQSDPFSRAHWGVPGKTLPPNHSGRHQKSSSTPRYLGSTRTAANLAVGDWIERIYKRRNTPLGMLGPAGYKNRTTQTTKAA